MFRNTKSLFFLAVKACIVLFHIGVDAAGNTVTTTTKRPTTLGNTTAQIANVTLPASWTYRGVWERTNLTGRSLCTGNMTTIENCENMKNDILAYFHPERKINITVDPECVYKLNATQFKSTSPTANTSSLYTTIRCRAKGTYVNENNTTDVVLMHFYNMLPNTTDIVSCSYWGAKNQPMDDIEVNVSPIQTTPKPMSNKVTTKPSSNISTTTTMKPSG